MKDKKIYVCGNTGYIGRNITEYFESLKGFKIVKEGRDADVWINCIGRKPKHGKKLLYEDYYASNVIATRNLVASANEVDALFIHLSTKSVDFITPIDSDYTSTKALAEVDVMGLSKKYLILRIPHIYGGKYYSGLLSSKRKLGRGFITETIHLNELCEMIKEGINNWVCNIVESVHGRFITSDELNIPRKTNKLDLFISREDIYETSNNY